MFFCVGSGVLTDGDGDAAHPHVLFVVGIGHPEVAVVGDAVAFLDATDILGAVAFELSSMTKWRHFTIHKIQRRVVQPILTQ